ncbi:MAG TPA: hypothetical protein VD886_10035 [Herpetosiphonaceae bacterium]|nr:hypothetical protein [Herpetosiphonaceae bacterium]
MRITTSRMRLIACFVLGGVLGALARPAAAEIPLANAQFSFQIQNLGNAPASCRYDIYANAGNNPIFSHTIASPVPVGGRLLVYTGAAAHGGTAMPAGVNSGKVECNQDVGAVVVFQNNVKRDTYIATKAPASIMYAPVVYKNYYNFSSSMRIQNTAASEQTILVTYYAPGSSMPAATRSAVLGPNGSITIDQAEVAALLPNVAYSARVAGSAPLALNVVIFGRPGSSVEPQLYSYSGVSSGATTIYTPVVLKNYFGFNTSTTVLNLGTQDATVKRTFSNGAIDTYTIQPNSSKVLLDFANPKLPGGSTPYASMIESLNGQPLAVLVNQSNNLNRATVSEGLTAADGGTKIVLPSVVKRFYGYNSAIVCQNVGSAAATLNVTYNPGPYAGALVRLSVGKSATIYQPSEAGLPDGFSGSAEITSDQPIACLANQDQNEPPYSGQNKDMLGAYNGIVKRDLPGESQTLAMPGLWLVK